MFYVLNRLKKSKIDEIGLKLGKIDKIVILI
jgi:predicted transcriptional regulator